MIRNTNCCDRNLWYQNFDIVIYGGMHKKSKTALPTKKSTFRTIYMVYTKILTTIVVKTTLMYGYSNHCVSNIVVV